MATQYNYNYYNLQVTIISSRQSNNSLNNQRHRHFSQATWFRGVLLCKQETLHSGCAIVGPPCTTLAQHWNNIDAKPVICRACTTAQHWPNIGSMSRVCWVSIQCTDWLPGKHDVLTQCCFNAGSSFETLAQHHTGIGWAFVFVGLTDVSFRFTTSIHKTFV